MTLTRAGLRLRPPEISHLSTPLLGSALRFGVVGIGGVAVNMVALHLLHGVGHAPLLWASPASVELAIVHNYLLNDRWTFRWSRPSLMRFVRFNLGALVAMVANVLVVGTLAAFGVHYLTGNLMGIGAGAALNFGVSRAWVWRGGAR
jgi:putative flippase GtrA